MPEMVEGGIGRDPSRPSAKVAGRVEARSGPVNAPESLHRKILCKYAVTDDADNPGVDFLLVLSKQPFEGLQVARCEPFQQLHLPLSVPTYRFLVSMVTTFFWVPIFSIPRMKCKLWQAKGIQKEKARTVSTPGPIGFC